MKHQLIVASLLFIGSPVLGAVIDDPPAVKQAEPAKVKVYDETADAKQQIASAMAKAKEENRRVLIQWGGNWCPWCIKLHELIKSDKPIRKELQYEYDVVFIDCGKPAGKNVDLAKSYGANVDKEGFPYLTILDANGKPVANQETAALEVKGADGKSTGVDAGHDRQAVLKFLKDHKADYLKADDILAKGVAEAKASGKTVFVHFGAPWCIWCHRLEDWMAEPTIQSILSKDFILVKIDTERTQGGQQMLDRMSDSKSGGIPWTVLISGDGTALINSNAKAGNIGYPAASEEIEHFAKMLAKAKKNMTDADVATLLDSLREKGKAFKN